MNNIYFSSLLCITILAFAPACNKKNAKTIQHDVKKMIELDNTVFELEEVDAENDQKANAKF